LCAGSRTQAKSLCHSSAQKKDNAETQRAQRIRREERSMGLAAAPFAISEAAAVLWV
jgi:hypothetical protein